MIRCEAPEHPDCWFECEGENCVAFYEQETQLCIGGCDESLLITGFATTIARTGWDSKISLHAASIRGATLSLIASVIRGIALTSVQFPKIYKGAPTHKIIMAAESIIKSIHTLDLSETYFYDLSFSNKNIEASLFYMMVATSNSGAVME